jgi:protein SCO1
MKKFVLSILLPLLIPVICFLFVWNVGGDGHVNLPDYFVIDSISKTPNKKNVLDTFYHRAADLNFVNQLGDSISVNQKFKGKIVVFNLFNTKDSGVGLQLNKNMQFLQKVYRKKDDTIAFMSIVSNPVSPALAELRNYANNIGANHDKWYFAMPNNKDLKQYLSKEIQLPKLDTTFAKASTNFVLLDPDRNIRGYYNALDTFEIRRCADDISLLMLEKKRKK